MDFESVKPGLSHPHVESEDMEKYIAERGAESGLKETKERVFEVLDIVHEDADAIRLIDGVLQSVFQYVETIYNMEVSMRMAKYRLEGDAYREFVENLDTRRKQSHDALLSSIASCNRYLFEHYEGKVPEGGICKVDPSTVQMNQRRAIGDWAIELESEILQQRSV